jgi:ribonucleoside-diphosphate reductase alpha chain|tara:strand:- start:12 stop:794 length:783 start_codon:yes stop_codon:yes gene_type:complete
MDKVIDQAIYPLPQQEYEAKSKRRMGLGVTGMANAIEALGFPYGSGDFIHEMEAILKVVRDTAYIASVQLAKEKGTFRLYDERYLQSSFIQSLPEHIVEAIKKYGIRNSHLLSIAPTGTISLTANNVSSGIEPVFALETTRTIQTTEGASTETIPDYGWRNWSVLGKTSDQCSVDDHLNVLLTAQKYVDSSVSKTCNVGEDVSWEDFKEIYMKAWRGGAKGCTTFRPSGKRYGILNAQPVSEENEAACYFDPDTGQRSCE